MKKQPYTIKAVHETATALGRTLQCQITNAETRIDNHSDMLGNNHRTLQAHHNTLEELKRVAEAHRQSLDSIRNAMDSLKAWTTSADALIAKVGAFGAETSTAASKAISDCEILSGRLDRSDTINHNEICRLIEREATNQRDITKLNTYSRQQEEALRKAASLAEVDRAAIGAHSKQIEEAKAQVHSIRCAFATDSGDIIIRLQNLEDRAIIADWLQGIFAGVGIASALYCAIQFIKAAF